MLVYSLLESPEGYTHDENAAPGAFVSVCAGVGDTLISELPELG